MEFNFRGKRALVTGAGKGIGKDLTLKLVELGAEVVAVSRTQSDLDELAKNSPRIKAVCLDIGNWDDTEAAMKCVGPIDFLVNNAGIMPMIKLGDYSKENVDEVLNINLKAVVNITQIIARGMIERGRGGSILNLSSIAGLEALDGLSLYGTTKGGLNLLTMSMAIEYGPHNIRVNAVNPTVVRTKLTAMFHDPSFEVGTAMRLRTPLRRYAEVEEVVNPILFLLSDNASMITGITMPIDGGLAASLH